MSPRVLVVAGSDPSGGAGLEADQKVLAAHKCYAMTATTALTAQNTQGVHDIYQIPSTFVKKQIDLCVTDIGVDILKTGMLASAETITVVANAIKQHSIPISVVDPVMVSTSGAQLLPVEAVQILLRELLPLTTILTPNVPEAKLLLSQAGAIFNADPQSVDDLIELGKQIHKLGPKHVLLKGGHLPLPTSKDSPEKNKTVSNILISDDCATQVIQFSFLETSSSHGTGCSLASAIAANLGNGLPVDSAVRQALNYVDAAIRTSTPIGRGFGPINHFHSISVRDFVPGAFIDYLLQREDVKSEWQAYTHHEFVQQLGDGTLPVNRFRDYLIQDYLFLIQFSRANSLAAYKAQNPEDIQRSAAIVLHVYKEMGLHIDYCAEFGLSKDDILGQEEKLACTSYTRFVLDIGHSEDWFALQMAMLPCLVGYGAIAQRLFNDPNTVWEGNKYAKWIKNYAADDFTEAVRLGRELVEKHSMVQSPQRIEQLVKIFVKATKLERSFWDMGLQG